MKMILWEIWSYAQIPFFCYLFSRYARKNIVGAVIAGALIGLAIEFATQPLWIYHFKITFYKGAPLSVPLGWGVMFAQVVFFSEKLYCWILQKDKIVPHDKRIFIFDLLAGLLIGFPLEALGLHAGVWDYNYGVLGWNMGRVPFFNMPIEALLGYALLMLLAPTFVRYWQGAFILMPKKGARFAPPDALARLDLAAEIQGGKGFAVPRPWGQGAQRRLPALEEHVVPAEAIAK